MRAATTLILALVPAFSIAFGAPGHQARTRALPAQIHASSRTPVQVPGYTTHIEGRLQPLMVDSTPPRLIYQLVGPMHQWRVPLTDLEAFAGVVPGAQVELGGHWSKNGVFVVKELLVLDEPEILGVSGRLEVLIAILKFTDAKVKATSRQISNFMFHDNSSVNLMFQENSFNKVSEMTGRVVGPYDVPISVNDPCSADRYEREGRNQLLEHGIIPNNYDHVMYIIPDAKSSGCGWCGLGEVGGDVTWITCTLDPDVYAHELGHNFGLLHASANGEEYGDRSCTMGIPSSVINFNGPHTHQLGWFDSEDILDLTVLDEPMVEFSIAPLTAPAGSPDPHLIKLKGSRYLSHRQKDAFDYYLSAQYLDGAAFHYWPSPYRVTELLEHATKGSYFEDATYDIYVKHVRTDDDGVTVRMSYDRNQPFFAEPGADDLDILPGEVLTFEVRNMNANQIDEVVLYRRLDTPDGEYEEVDRTEEPGATLLEDQPACRNEGYLYRALVVMGNGDSYYTDSLDIKRVGFSRICLQRD